MHESSIVLQFFNTDQPCPAEISFCTQLREKYLEEVNNATVRGCKKCHLTNIKSKYMQVVWQKYMEHVNNKDKPQNIML
jgi:Zn-finger protein